MARVICRNTFLDFSPAEDEKSIRGGQRCRSAEPGLTHLHAEPFNANVDSQLQRLNRLFDSNNRSFLDELAVTQKTLDADNTNLPELLQLQKKLQLALAPRVLASCMSQSPMLSRVASKTSVSTMCSASADEFDTSDEQEMGDENLDFNLKYMDHRPNSAPQAPQASAVQFTTVARTRVRGSPIQDPIHACECPAEQNTNVNSLPSRLHQRQFTVPRTRDLAAEFAVSDDANSPSTTIMIRNIANRYTQRELVLELEEMGFEDSFDFVYLPLDKSTRANLGYAFVNFVNATWASKCMDDFKDYRFKKYRNASNKVAVASVAHIQGLEKNLAHYENKFVNSCKLKKGRPLVLIKASSAPNMG
jgi:hypothetical protein